MSTEQNSQNFPYSNSENVEQNSESSPQVTFELSPKVTPDDIKAFIEALSNSKLTTLDLTQGNENDRKIQN